MFVQTFPDNAIRREMSILIVYCSFDGCSWTGQFKEFEVFDNLQLVSLFITKHIADIHGC